MAGKETPGLDLAIKESWLQPAPKYQEVDTATKAALAAVVPQLDDDLRAELYGLFVSFYAEATKRIAFGKGGLGTNQHPLEYRAPHAFIRDLRRVVQAYEALDPLQLELLNSSLSHPVLEYQARKRGDRVVYPQRLPAMMSALRRLVDCASDQAPLRRGRPPLHDLSPLADDLCLAWVAVTDTKPIWNDRNRRTIAEYHRLCSPLIDIEFALEFSSKPTAAKGETRSLRPTVTRFSEHRGTVALAMRNAARRLRERIDSLDVEHISLRE